MKKFQYLRSRERRGRMFHTYRRDGKEKSLGVHGLPENHPKVLAAYAAEHARWEDGPDLDDSVKVNSFGWALDLYLASNHWKTLALATQQNRLAIYSRYRKAQGERPLSSITGPLIEIALYTKGGFAAINELKALKPVFKHLVSLRIMDKNPCAGIELEKPKSKGFITAEAADIARFQKRWPIGTRERLIFDLALLTGAARVDLVKLSRKNIQGDVLVYHRQKTGTRAEIPMTHELRAVIARTPDISPSFITTASGKPFSAASLGNGFGEAAQAADVKARLHGLRKAFCVYWAEKGASTHQIAAMAGHLTLAEVERYTRAADRSRMVKLLIETG